MSFINWQFILVEMIGGDPVSTDIWQCDTGWPGPDHEELYILSQPYSKWVIKHFDSPILINITQNNEFLLFSGLALPAVSPGPEDLSLDTGHRAEIATLSECSLCVLWV